MVTQRRPIEVFSMAFLDVISCSFGAIILLLVLSLALEPQTLEHMTAKQEVNIKDIQKEREQLLQKSQALINELAEKKERLEVVKQVLTQLNRQLVDIENKDKQVKVAAKDQERIEGELKAVLQTLTVEMKNLLSETEYRPPSKETIIGGIPVDSEYIIFVIDTSGSMLLSAWPMVIKKVEEVLRVYPEVKGIQILNDMGRYMFSEYAGRWIPDTPARRKEVLRRLRKWRSFSNSSPVEGITHAVRRYFKKDKRISLYVFGDDFSSGSVDAVIHEVARINKRDKSGKPRVRIHAFGFPVLYSNPAISNEHMVRFSHLMRTITDQNAGSFVGLTKLR